MAPEIRIAFLVFLVLTLFLLIIRTKGTILGDLSLFQVILDFFLVLVMAGTALTFLFLIFRVDPLPLIRNGAYQLSLQQNVSFADAIPENLQDNLAVADVMKVDTDGDDYKEWVVFYRFDKKDGSGPIQGVIYDNDRGNPPVVFPYILRVPSRDYLSEKTITLDLVQVTPDQNGPNQENLQEILIESSNELSIFRFRQNSEVWDFPRDAPPRYEAIGFFRGSGGVRFDPQTKQVTVIDRDGLERSRMATRSVYGLNPITNTFWDQFYGPTELDRKLAAPLFTTIDFFNGLPTDVLDAPFPEEIVLAFYRYGDNEEKKWTLEDLLAGDAATEFANGNTAYFGLSNFDTGQDIAVTHLQYYPSLETDPDLLVTGGGRDVVTGEQGQLNLVDVTFAAGGAPLQSIRYKMELIEGRWKITGRLSLTDPPG